MSKLASALIAELDDQVLEQLADALWPRLRDRLQPTEDAWLTSAQAAEHLAISVDALHRLTADDESEIPFTRDTPGGRCYFLRSELDAWRQRSRHARAGAVA